MHKGFHQKDSRSVRRVPCACTCFDFDPGGKQSTRLGISSRCLPGFLPGVIACGRADMAASPSVGCPLLDDSSLGDFPKKGVCAALFPTIRLSPCPTELFPRLSAPSEVTAYNKQLQDARPQRRPLLQSPLTTAPAPSTVCIHHFASCFGLPFHIDKLHKHGRRLPHLVTQHPRSPSAEEAVTNILYNTPPPSTEPFKRSVCYCLFFFLTTTVKLTRMRL